MQKSKKKKEKKNKKKKKEQKKKALSWIRTRDNITTLPGRRECPDMGRPDKGSLSVTTHQIFPLYIPKLIHVLYAEFLSGGDRARSIAPLGSLPPTPGIGRFVNDNSSLMYID